MDKRISMQALSLLIGLTHIIFSLTKYLPLYSASPTRMVRKKTMIFLIQCHYLFPLYYPSQICWGRKHWSFPQSHQLFHQTNMTLSWRRKWARLCQRPNGLSTEPVVLFVLLNRSRSWYDQRLFFCVFLWEAGDYDHLYSSPINISTRTTRVL